MKKLTFLTIACISLGLFSCKKSDVDACIAASQTEILKGEAIEFDNCSTEYLEAEWDFGDGNQSEVSHTSHRFEEAGSYNINLRVLDKRGNASEASQTINVYEAKVKSIVIEYNYGPMI